MTPEELARMEQERQRRILTLSGLLGGDSAPQVQAPPDFLGLNPGGEPSLVNRLGNRFSGDMQAMGESFREFPEVLGRAGTAMDSDIRSALGLGQTSGPQAASAAPSGTLASEEVPLPAPAPAGPSSPGALESIQSFLAAPASYFPSREAMLFGGGGEPTRGSAEVAPATPGASASPAASVDGSVEVPGEQTPSPNAATFPEELRAAFRGEGSVNPALGKTLAEQPEAIIPEMVRRGVEPPSGKLGEMSGVTAPEGPELQRISSPPAPRPAGIDASSPIASLVSRLSGITGGGSPEQSLRLLQAVGNG